MKKIAVIALSLSLASSAAFAQDRRPSDPVDPGIDGSIDVPVVTGYAPGVVIAGGFGAGGIVLGVFGLFLLAGLGGSANVSATNTTN